MIRYQSGAGSLQILCQLHGSVFPRAFCFALPAALVSVALSLLIHEWQIIPMSDLDSIMNNSAAWGSFGFLVSFTVVFRTQQSYSRFCEAVSSTHKMGAEWFDAASGLVAFTRCSEEDLEQVLIFHNTLIRLISMLHAAALAELETNDACKEHNYLETKAFEMSLIDPESLDAEALKTLCSCDTKVVLLYQWIQALVVKNIQNKVLSMPAPIVTRCFQELGAGMVYFREAMKIASVPFPFPYAQSCDLLLLMHWFITPFVVTQWCHSAWWSAIFTFVQVFALWALNIIGVELQNPYGQDPNDIDCEGMHDEINEQLRLLLRPGTSHVPTMKSHSYDGLCLALDRAIDEDPDVKGSCFQDLWVNLVQDERDFKTPEKLRSTDTFMSQGSVEQEESSENPWTRMAIPSEEPEWYRSSVTSCIGEKSFTKIQAVQSINTEVLTPSARAETFSSPRVVLEEKQPFKVSQSDSSNAKKVMIGGETIVDPGRSAGQVNKSKAPRSSTLEVSSSSSSSSPSRRMKSQWTPQAKTVGSPGGDD